MIGKTLSHFRILAKIGEGGMGVVYRAEDTDLRRPVALKVLPPDLVGNKERRLRFLREARAAAAVTHPNIATIHEVGQADRVVFIAMELVEGKTLREHIGGRPMPIKDALRIGTEMAEGVAEAHKAGVIHRDLKPDNVIVDSNGHAKILDFGLAKLREERGDLSPEEVSKLETISGEITRAGKVLGTVAYMSPEQARGRTLDARSDLFSFGTTLYEMVTGELPFQGKTSTDILSAIIRDEPVPVSQQNTEIPQELERIISECLEKDAAERYQHADQLAVDLRKLRRVPASGMQAARTASSPVAMARTGIWEQLFAGRASRIASIGALAVLAGVFGYFHFRPTEQAGGTGAGQNPRKMIVVLPFENLGAPEDKYFADGMTEEITSRLAVVRGLGVISRKSALQYAGTDKRTKQIGEELGVGYVLEGSVRWAQNPAGASRVRITPQLMRVSDDTHLWAEAYDRVIEDIFQIQSEIAEKVMDQLGVTLLEHERLAIESKPTENFEAYQAYLRGLNHGGYTSSGIQIAIQMFERAVELDPGFALAHTMLSKAHSSLYTFNYDRTEKRLKMAKDAIDRAMELAPDVPEVHLVLGYYHYYGHRQYERALEELILAEKGMPNSAELIAVMGYIRRRQGRWEAALENLHKAFALDPLSHPIPFNLGSTYQMLRRFEEADRHYNQAIALAPDRPVAYIAKAFNLRSWKGALPEARVTLEAIPSTYAKDHNVIAAWFWQEFHERDYQAALDRLASSPEQYLRSIAYPAPKSLLQGFVYDQLDQPERARRAYDAARIISEDELKATPDDAGVHSNLGLALAGLGHKEEAIQKGERAVKLYSVSKDAYTGPHLVYLLAKTYTMVGEYDAALDQIEYLLSVPSDTSLQILQLEPQLQPLRGDPRFQQLLLKYG